jgi:hypothetical protein
MPREEQVVLGVSLFHFSWENTAGLPSQVVMRAPRGSLADVESGRSKASLDSVIRVEEF